MTIGFLIAGVLIPLLLGNVVKIWAISLAGLFMMMAVFFPHHLSKPREYWLALGEKLGHTNSLILFTVIYLTLFSLVHLFFILSGRDLLLRRWKKYESTFKEKSKISSFSDPF